ncbi:Putative peptidoglycan binding domain protein [Pseudoruegeria aquimaris]|uniref:Putative peptidoglycan binding domain protein n=1 Tax=Pseudoruegeria aquimaris TaxID=393663 RepID=A0A1Y5RGE4_9RHOB|nr:peptidoglycan-binding domain-containing protein [Pseudoruegeria aquimaris]SLN16828.1 Putative peptidoglycan binding domain protein [Pseudoruegeria aquimaris]
MPANRPARFRRPVQLRRPVAALAALALLAGCVEPERRQVAVAAADTTGSIRTRTQAPDAEGDGQCWTQDTQPAIIQTITEQVLVSPARYDDDDTLLSPATYGTQTRQEILRERAEVWFRTPCPPELTVPFVATVQRALTVRGYYTGPINGQLDGPTRAAIKAYQTPRGLESQTLSLDAARQLGVAAYGRETPQEG